MEDTKSALKKFLDGYCLRTDGGSCVGIRPADLKKLLVGYDKNRGEAKTFAFWQIRVVPGQKRRFVAWEEY